MSKSYITQHIKRQNKWKVAMPEYLSGLFTSKYGDEFYMHYLCPLCSTQVNVIKKLGMSSSEITTDFEKDVAGWMANEMRRNLAQHYRSECGYSHKRRKQTGQILFDKYQDGYFI